MPTVDAGPAFCDPLIRLAYRGAQPSGIALVELAAAVSTLAHEAEHAAGNWDEAAAECYGLQRAADLAVALGATRAYAEGLADTNWDEVHPFLTEEYQSPECREGGALDLNPTSSDWP